MDALGEATQGVSNALPFLVTEGTHDTDIWEGYIMTRTKWSADPIAAQFPNWPTVQVQDWLLCTSLLFVA